MASGIEPIANLRGKVNSSNALVVTLDGGSAAATTFVGPAADNTAAVPFTFTSDTNTGLASSAADTVNLVTGGTSRVTVSTTGVTVTVPLGVNGALPTQDSLALKATSSGFGFSLRDSAGNDGAIAGMRESTGGGRIFVRAAYNGSDTINADGLTGSLTFTGTLFGPVQALSGAGAVNVTQLSTAFTSSGVAQALTLANGTAGQTKYIVHVVDGGSGVLTPTTKIGFTTITFTNVGDAATLLYTAQGWAIVGIFGAVAA